MSAGTPAGGAELLGLAGSLLVVLGVILALAWLLRRVQGLRVQGTQSVRVLGGTAVGAKERVLIVQAGGQQFLIGVAPNAVNLLHHFDEPLPEPDESAASIPVFAQKLQSLMRSKARS
ncbi:MAG: flagellar biosynthetic protein FliO [Panacagrimonas sp.]